MISALITANLLFVASQGVQVDVGRADWKAMPPLIKVARNLPMVQMVDRVEDILRSGQCQLSGQSPKRFDITIPYAALVEPDGTSTHVVVQDTGCAPLETLVGTIVLQMAAEGDFKKTGEAKARWYASELNFNLQ